MATIQQLRDTVVSTAGGDRQALNALEEACIENADLTGLFEAYRDAVGAVEDVEALGQLSQRFAELLDDLIARERISAKRSQLRRRRGICTHRETTIVQRLICGASPSMSFRPTNCCNV